MAPMNRMMVTEIRIIMMSTARCVLRSERAPLQAEPVVYLHAAPSAGMYRLLLSVTL
jgi:hypothetical protein